MLIKKALLAAAAVMTLTVPAAAMAQDFGGYGGGYAGYHDGYRGGYDGWRGREIAYRHIEREREMRREFWRLRFEHRHDWRPYGGDYRFDDHRPYGGDYRPY